LPDTVWYQCLQHWEEIEMSVSRVFPVCLIAGVAALAGCQGPPASEEPFTKQAIEAAAQIDEQALITPIRELADDRYEGRATASPGDLRARSYLIEQLKALGYKPAAAGGGWEQSFDVVGVNATVPDQWQFSTDSQDVRLNRWDDFVVSSGVQQKAATVRDAEVVFVGYGIQAPEYDWDDFKGQDLRGKVLLMVNNDPDWDPALFAGDTRLYYGRWDYKYASAARQGAAGAIIIHTTVSAGYPWQVVQTSWTGEQFELPAENEPRVQITGWVTEDAARRLVQLAGKDLDQLVAAARRRDFQPVPLGIRTSLSLQNTVNRTTTANVLGILEGSDPVLKQQVVIFTAHHDHLGIGEPDDTGDRIYNGARDNGSGMAMVLGIARAFAALNSPPRRSVLILFPAAEEQGLLGSKYYAGHPTFPAGRIAANINYDSGNIWGKTRDVTLVGMGKSSLDKVALKVVRWQARTLKPDQFPDRGTFYRSDQFSFAQIGVPALYFKPGTDFLGRPPGWGREQIEHYEAVHYHQPSDELDDSWAFEGMIDDARLGFWAGLIVANADELPVWNPGDEFEAARLQALAQVSGH